MTALDRIHNLSLRVLTLCGFCAMICLAVNIATALIMAISDKKVENTCDN